MRSCVICQACRPFKSFVAFFSLERLIRIVDLFVCIQMWRLWKTLLHCSQLNLLSPTCMSMCVFRCGLWLKLFSHWEHLNVFRPLYILRWRFRKISLLNDLLQISHMYYTCNHDITRIRNKRPYLTQWSWDMSPFGYTCVCQVNIINIKY